MEKKDNSSKANKPLREDDQTQNNDLPYDPNINKEDKQALQERGRNMSPTDDQFLDDRERPVDFAADDLDIPGRNQKHTGPDIPDEENFQFRNRGGNKNSSDIENIPDEDSKNQ